MNGVLTGPHIHTGPIPGHTARNPRSAWGRVVAVRLSARTSNSQWLDNLITSITLIKNASGLALFPHLGIAAGITVQILEIIKVRPLLVRAI